MATHCKLIEILVITLNKHKLVPPCPPQSYQTVWSTDHQDFLRVITLPVVKAVFPKPHQTSTSAAQVFLMDLSIIPGKTDGYTVGPNKSPGVQCQHTLVPSLWKVIHIALADVPPTSLDVGLSYPLASALWWTRSVYRLGKPVESQHVYQTSPITRHQVPIGYYP